MERTLITVTEYCSYHPSVEPDFVLALADGGLIVCTVEAEETLIPYDELRTLERLSRLHYDLQINLEGLEAISHLLHRVDIMQEEVRSLQNRLAFFEDGESSER